MALRHFETTASLSSLVSDNERGSRHRMRTVSTTAHLGGAGSRAYEDTITLDEVSPMIASSRPGKRQPAVQPYDSHGHGMQNIVGCFPPPFASLKNFTLQNGRAEPLAAEFGEHVQSGVQSNLRRPSDDPRMYIDNSLLRQSEMYLSPGLAESAVLPYGPSTPKPATQDVVNSPEALDETLCWPESRYSRSSNDVAAPRTVHMILTEAMNPINTRLVRPETPTDELVVTPTSVL